MTECVEQLDFGFLLGKQICARFDGGELSSDGGMMLLAEADQRLGLTSALAACVPDPRDQSQVQHKWHTLFAQRSYQIACGYEDADDADDLRGDWAFKTALERRPDTDPDLASQPTFSRFENCVSRTSLRRMAEVFIDQFVRRYVNRRECRIILDFDATDDPAHGQQQFVEFHGHYKEYCYLPLIVTAQVDDGPQELLVAMLRPGNVDAAAYAVAILKRLVPRLRQACPKAEFLFRADGGFARPEIYDWCEDDANRIDYEINLPQNPVLQRLAAPYLELVHATHAETGQWERRFAEVLYQAKQWPQQRRVVIKAEVTINDNGEPRDNPRFVVTNLTAGQAQAIYEHYGDRGEMENRIKELKRDLQMDRTSCHRFVANQLRVFLHAAAYLFHCELRRQLHGTSLSKAQVSTLQRKLLKVALRIRETARRIWLHFASSYPWQEVWALLLERLRAAPT